MDRRQFLLAAAVLAAGCSRKHEPATDAAAQTAPLGLQLYTVRDLMAEDMAATLALVAEVGYREVEFAGYFDRSPADVRRLLSDTGLTAPSTHIGYGDFAADVARVVDHAAAVGHEFVIVPSVPEEERATLDDYLRHADNFDRWSEACGKAGLRFGYHNHMFEFEAIDGRIPYDVLLSETDPGRVLMELDLAWATGGNADVLAYFQAWPGRFPLCHLKDITEAREETDIGDGHVAFAEILAQAGQAGLVHGFVERDHPADARASIRRNYDSMSPLWASHIS
jgi:sugar phosphate isomerase/epimerase